MAKQDPKLTKEEQQIVDEVEQGLWQPVPPEEFEKLKKYYGEIARNSMRKNKTISIRLTERDLNRMKVRAAEEGIPYQTLISSVIHKYADGKDFAK